MINGSLFVPQKKVKFSGRFPSVSWLIAFSGAICSLIGFPKTPAFLLRGFKYQLKASILSIQMDIISFSSFLINVGQEIKPPEERSSEMIKDLSRVVMTFGWKMIQQIVRKLKRFCYSDRFSRSFYSSLLWGREN